MIGTIRISQIPTASPLNGLEDFIVNQSGATRLVSLDNVVGFVSFVPSSGIATYSSVSGVSTVSEGLTGTPDISVGIISATSLTVSGIISANNGFNIGISSVGIAITTGPINTLNFVGAGNTFSVDGTTVNIAVSGSTNISYASTTRILSSSTGFGTELPLVTSTDPGLQPASGYGSIVYAAQVTLNFSTLNGQINTISLTGALELLTSNLANGREVRLRLVCDGTQRALTFPVDWKFVGTKPATIAASKVAILSLAAFGASNADVIAAYAVQS
jgi:hypothetical protein